MTQNVNIFRFNYNVVDGHIVIIIILNHQSTKLNYNKNKENRSATYLKGSASAVLFT